MGFFKKLVKGIGRGIKKVTRSKIIGKLLKGASTIVSFLPIPASGLIGKGLGLVAKVQGSKGGKIAGKLFKSFRPTKRGFAGPPVMVRALPAITKTLTFMQRRVLGQPSFVKPGIPYTGKYASKGTATSGTAPRRRSPPTVKAKPSKRKILFNLGTPRRKPFVPAGKLVNLNTGSSTAVAAAPKTEALSTGNKIAIAGVGLSVVTTLLLAAFKK